MITREKYSLTHDFSMCALKGATPAATLLAFSSGPYNSFISSGTELSHTVTPCDVVNPG